MKYHLQILIICFLMFQAVHSLQVCQDGILELNENVTHLQATTATTGLHQSDDFKTLYEIEEASDVFTLKAKTYTEVLDEEDLVVDFEITETQLLVQEGDQIQFVSPSGGCVVIDKGSSLEAYTNQLVTAVQDIQIQTSSFVSVEASEDCSVIQIVDANSDNKIYVDSAQVESETPPPASTVFEETLRFGVDGDEDGDGDGSIYEYFSDTNDFHKSTVDGVLSEVLEVKMSEDEAALLVFSKDENDSYSLNVYDTTQAPTFSSIHSKTWEATQIRDTPILAIQREMKASMVRDSNGMLSFLKIKNIDGTPSVVEVELDDDAQNDNLTIKEIVSVGSDFLVSYDEANINYFQIQGVDVLVYLGSYTFNAAQQLEDYRADQTLSESSESVVHMIATPDLTQECVEPIFVGTTEEIFEENKVDEDGDVHVCPAACASCTQRARCTQCEPGYVIENEKCIECEGNCKTCNANDPTQCFSCFSTDNYDETQNTCTPSSDCEGTCLRCSTTDSTICLECPEFYYLQNDKCEKCEIDGCRDCSSDETQCNSDQCEAPFIYYENECVECVTGCLKCSQTDLSSCQQCTPGFYPAQDTTQDPVAQICNACFDNCETCQDDTSCETCVDGYKTDSEFTKCILECSDSCLTCNEDMPDQCLSCRYGYDYDEEGLTCTMNLECNTTGTCKSCPNNYAIEDNQCFECESQDKNCNGCNYDDLTQCLTCMEGYYLNGSQCQECSDQCKTCQDDSLCFECQDGYWLLKDKDSTNEEGFCQACQSPCATCHQKNDTCLTCIDGYSLINRKCLAQNTVDWDVTMATTVAQFIDISQALFATIQNSTAELENIADRKGYFMNTVEDGSAIITGNISTTEEQLDAAKAAVEEALTQGDEIGGVAVESSNVEVAESEEEEQESSNIKWILGICIPLGIILIAGLVLLAIKMKNRKKDGVKDESDGQSEKNFNNDGQGTERI